jgi:NADH-quinone oxidoreductase subunit N
MTMLDLIAIFPEVTLLVMACVIAVCDLYITSPQRTGTYVLSVLTLGAVAVMQSMQFAQEPSLYVMNHMLVVDPMGSVLKAFAAMATLVTLVYARYYAADREFLKGELFTLSLFAYLGMCIMISGNNFLMLYLGLELLSLSMYAMVALRRDHGPATEAAMKYFVLGALASGFLLYGMSMMYGATGSLDLNDVSVAVASGVIHQTVLVFGLVFIVTGLAFKLGVVPFHMWVPDVYHGAPTSTALLIGSAPKLAAFAMSMRLLVETLWPLANDWQQMLAVLAVASLLIGNLAAIAQTNLKRMLAYSTIAQMGFVLLGMLSGIIDGKTDFAANAYSSAMFYIITYVLTALGTFGIMLLLSRAGHEAEDIADLKGLNQRSPLYAAIMTVFMFSLAGVPPAVGFYAKLAVLQAMITTGQGTLLGLAIVAVLLSLIAAFYYLRIVKTMYFDDATDQAPLEAGPDMRAVLVLNGAAVLLLGILPGGLFELTKQAIIRTLAS